jgi:hypothetical protein
MSPKMALASFYGKQHFGRFRSEADMHRPAKPVDPVENDP